MSVFEILDTLLLKPLQLLFEVIYMMAYRIIGNPGLSIIVLSLVMNFLVLPLYLRADAMQEEEKQTEMRLRRGVSHIKKTFKGDERMMMLQTYYRQNGYKPTYVLRGAVSLFLEIPFFIAAYRFLSELSLLDGVTFGPIADLGRPDGMLAIAGISVNILPIIMTAVNLVSCVIFTKGSPVKQKLQLYGMAAFFLVFLYNSPSGLVFYWTLNNTFSLVKTVFYKLKDPLKVLGVLFSAAGAGVFVYGVFFYDMATFNRIVFFVFLSILMQAPLLYVLFKDKIRIPACLSEEDANGKAFLAGGIFLAVLTGLLIPSAVIHASPQEFINVNDYYNPLWFLASAFCFAVGAFVIWAGVFYRLARPSVQAFLDRMIWILCGVAVVDYMFFGKDLGILTAELTYEQGLWFSTSEQLFNILVVLGAAVLLFIVSIRWKKRIPELLIIGSVAIVGMSAVNMAGIHSGMGDVGERALENSKMPEITLSRKGKNVAVIMLDRAVGEYIPYLFAEKPELREQFDGFTYYSNVVSFGGFTNFGMPPLLGGYEYTPLEMNKRGDEPLVSKHNESVKLMPVLFDDNGYEVTVCDPVYANYEWLPDLSVFEDYPDIERYVAKGKFLDDSMQKASIESKKRRFFCYGILKAVPLCFQGILYEEGNYNQSSYGTDDGVAWLGQTLDGMYVSDGLYSEFMKPYRVLENLPVMTDVTKRDADTFLFLSNDTTHEPMLLQTPDYVPAKHADNRAYEAENQGRFTVEERALKMENDWQLRHYYVNMAAMLQLGKWFDYLKANDVYDNTRIILVSDHGQKLYHLDERIIGEGDDIEHFYPLLMVKDFGSEELSTSEEFMTTADVPCLAMEGLISNPVNPFTGKEIDMEEKTAHDQYIIVSEEWDTAKNNGNTFLPAKWYAVHDDMLDRENWRMVAEDEVLTEEK